MKYIHEMCNETPDFHLKTTVLNQGLLSEVESCFFKDKSILIFIFKMVMVILSFNILRHGPWQMHL